MVYICLSMHAKYGLANKPHLSELSYFLQNFLFCRKDYDCQNKNFPSKNDDEIHCFLGRLQFTKHLPRKNKQRSFAGLTGNILVGEWQITLLVYFRHVMECSCKSTLKICQLEFYLISFTNSKLFLPFTVERKVFDCSKH